MSTDIRTGGALPVDTTQLQNLEFDPKQLGTGRGLLDAIKNAPDAPPPETVNKLAASLAGVISRSDMPVDVDVLLIQIAVAMRDTESTNEKGKITTDQEAKKAQMLEKEKKLEESAKKLQEALDKKNSGSLIDKIKLAFEWLGAILAIAVAAIMIATGAGAVVGALLIAAAVTALVMAVDSTVTVATGHGIAGNIAKAAGASPEEIAKADMGFKISLAVLGIVFSLAAGGASMAGSVRSAAQAGKDAAEMGAKLKDIASAAKTAFVRTMDESGAAMSTSARLLEKATTVGDAAITAGTASVDVARAATKYQETDARAEAKRLEASGKQSEAIMQMLDDMIDQALARLMASTDRFNAILDDITEAINDRSQTMSSARFTG